MKNLPLEFSRERMLETRTVNLGDGHVRWIQEVHQKRNQRVEHLRRMKNMQTAVAFGFKFKGLYTVLTYVTIFVLMFYCFITVMMLWRADEPESIT